MNTDPHPTLTVVYLEPLDPRYRPIAFRYEGSLADVEDRDNPWWQRKDRETA